ncbi:MAG: TonB-dependent receptor plug domain-containing protein, partial [Sphingopyxis terrae]
MQLKRNLLSAALASAIALTATGVNAQTAQPAEQTNEQAEATELDTVVVTGIRRGIESAISVKRDSTSIVEAISAEDIGKLPDVSIAESLARLPGLAAQRVAGRAQVISVRGLSPDFSTTLLNGREMVSTGDNRSVEFDQYPSELVSGVT